MREYFLLQYRMTNRKLKEFGLEPIVGYVLISAGFVALSVYLFSKTEFAQYVMLLGALGASSRLSDIHRSDFLRLCFGDKQARLIRLTENFLVALPFLILLLYEHTFWSAPILAVTSLIMSLTSYRAVLNFTIPTPFSRKPFEFAVGFRKTFYLFAIAYILTVVALSVHNLNLGIFAFLLIFLVALGYYTKPENEYYVWIFAASPAEFIREKIKTALLYSTMSALPILFCLTVFYFHSIGTILLFYFLGCAFLATVVIAKYSAYPKEMNLVEGVLLAASLYFPPLLIVVAPYFYSKSKRQLRVLFG